MNNSNPATNRTPTTATDTTPSKRKTFSLNQVSSQLTRQINDLLGASEEPNPTLRALLTQLQQAIEAEPGLEDEQKAKALLDVAELATAGQSINQAHMQQLAKHSIKALQEVTAPLPKDAGLCAALREVLPKVRSIFEQ
jgi:hypothetical protein